MRYVLLKLSDDAAEKMVKKAGPRALGVWDIPELYCDCSDKVRFDAMNWVRDPATYWPKCKKCGGLLKPLISLGIRLRTALGRNIIKRLRG